MAQLADGVGTRLARGGARRRSIASCSGSRRRRPNGPPRSGWRRLVAATTGASEVWVADDAVTAHAGALSGGWGVSLVAGTGVACLAAAGRRRAADHRRPRVPAGGRGRRVLDRPRWASRPCCGRARGADPTPAWRRPRGAASATWRISRCASTTPPRPVDDIAAFAPDVLEAAGAGDEVARRIVDDAADELATHRRPRAPPGRRRNGTRPVAVPVALGGRLLLEPTAAADGARGATRRRGPVARRPDRGRVAARRRAAPGPGRRPRAVRVARHTWSRRRVRA